jgi:hypothetical protein
MILIQTGGLERVALHIHHEGSSVPLIVVAPPAEGAARRQTRLGGRKLGMLVTVALVMIAAAGGYTVAPRGHAAGMAQPSAAALNAPKYAPAQPGRVPPALQHDLALPPTVTSAPGPVAAPSPAPPANPFGLER